MHWAHVLGHWVLWAALMLALIVLGLVALVYHLIMAIISRND
jgi:hypothetical protein